MNNKTISEVSTITDKEIMKLNTKLVERIKWLHGRMVMDHDFVSMTISSRIKSNDLLITFTKQYIQIDTESLLPELVERIRVGFVMMWNELSRSLHTLSKYTLELKDDVIYIRK